MRTTINIAIIALAFTGCAGFAASAKISRAQAERIARRHANGGKVQRAKLEEVRGKLVWSFDIVPPGTWIVKKVRVDASTGEIVSRRLDKPGYQLLTPGHAAKR